MRWLKFKMMKPNDKARDYIQEHWQTHTLADLAKACRLTKTRIFFLCRDMGIAPATITEKKANIIRLYEGKKTIGQLASILDCDISTIRRICREYELPYRPHAEQIVIPEKKSIGRPRLPYIPPDPPKKPIERPPSVYSNPTREEMIEKILNK